MPATNLPRAAIYLAACLVCIGVARAENPFSGHWEGTILVAPAEFEYDVHLDLTTTEDHRLLGRISLPAQDLKQHEVQELSLDGSKISFVYSDGKDRSVFSGQISPDGRRIEGMLSEVGKTFPFVLERRPMPSGEVKPVVRSLSRGGDELRELFARDAGHVRMVIILSPTCPGCQNCARVVRRYVFEQNDNPNLRAYVVWEPIYPEDNRAAAEKSAALIADSRVTHFWADHRYAGSSFQEAVGLKSSPAWDVVLVFDGGKRWLAEGPAPAPNFFMHNLKGDELPKERRLNGLKLAEQVRAVAAAEPCHTAMNEEKD